MYVAVTVSMPPGNDPAGMMIVATPLASVAAVEVKVPPVSVTVPVGVGLGEGSLTVTVTDNGTTVVTLNEAGVTTTVGVYRAIPLSVMVCVDATAFRLVSVRTNEPLKFPSVPGSKLIGNWQEAPAASVAAADEVVDSCGQADVPVLLKTKPVAILGLFPVAGIGKVSVALPLFSSVTV